MSGNQNQSLDRAIRIIELVEKNNNKERIEEIVSEWEIPSYNHLDDVTRQYHHYSLFTDDESYVEIWMEHTFGRFQVNFFLETLPI